MTTFLLLALVTIATEAACTDSYTTYTDKTIRYIKRNKAASTIYYLGTKSSATQCRDSCIDFNYLCDKSSSYIYENDGAVITFNNILCSITISGNKAGLSYIKITDEPILSSNYIIEVELTHSIGESGFYWKSNNDESASDYSNYYDYYFAIEGNDYCITGYSDPTEKDGYQHLSYGPLAANYNTRNTLSATMSGSSFNTSLNGEQHYSDTLRSSHSSYGYAGIWSYAADTTYHSFKIIFPSGGSEAKICAAYILDSSNRCYGYYGTNFTTIEHSVSSKKNYSSGIFSDCHTVQPTSTTFEFAPISPIKINLAVVFTAIASIVCILITCFGVIYIYYKRRKKESNEGSNIEQMDNMNSANVKTQQIQTIESTTGTTHVEENIFQGINDEIEGFQSANHSQEAHYDTAIDIMNHIQSDENVTIRAMKHRNNVSVSSNLSPLIPNRMNRRRGNTARSIHIKREDIEMLDLSQLSEESSGDSNDSLYGSGKNKQMIPNIDSSTGYDQNTNTYGEESGTEQSLENQNTTQGPCD